jgi:hypothetical protein
MSVEGETEKWYFEHLKKLVNESEDSIYKLKLNPKIKKSPKSFTKTLTALDGKVRAFHICDYESNEPIHVEQFQNILKELKTSNAMKKVNYKLGYTNFSFELWMILHKKQQLSVLPHRKNYLSSLNQGYCEEFQFLNDYKKEKNFKRILSKIDLNDVKNAVNYATNIREIKCKNGVRMIEYLGFEYYKENPDLTINECVYEMLKECGIMS